MTDLELRPREPTVTLTHGQLQQIREAADRKAELARREKSGTSRSVVIVCGCVAGLFMLLTFAMAIFKMFMASMEAQATRNHELAMKAVEQAQASSVDPSGPMFLGAFIVIFVILFCLAMLKGKVK